MNLPIISADERLAETRGVKGCIFGKSGIGKTSLLWTLDADKTLFFDLEAGDLAIEGWQGDTIRPRTWNECRDFAVFIGGPNPALEMTSPTARRISRRCAGALAILRHLINMTPSSSTPSPWPGGYASSGPRASHKQSRSAPASRTCAAPMACTVRR
jgi:hypothetical protein